MKGQCCEEKGSDLLIVSLDGLLDRVTLCPIFCYWLIKTGQVSGIWVQ